MQPSQEYRNGAKAYRNGFLIGAFCGIVVCLIMGKTMWILPIVMGLLFGAIAITYKMK